MANQTHSSACILCSLNCGIKIEVDDHGKFVKITGDKDHPNSQGYICQKATRLNYYQDQKRLTAPLRRRDDGSFEEISWEVAIQEIADKLVHTRDTYGGETIAYAGGGGQGNHLGGLYASALRAACRTPYFYSALAQEKTGNFWVHGKLFGRQNTNYEEPVQDAQYVLVIGANPLQSHGIHKARKVINELARDPNRTLVVIDPRKTETAKKADLFLQVKPGHDAWLMSAILGAIIQEGLEDRDFIARHTTGFEEIKPHFLDIPVGEYAAIAGVSEEQVRTVARGMAAAETVAVRSDLGIEQSYNSTLNAYLARLLFLVTGNFGKHGTNHLVSYFFPLLGHSKDPEAGGVVTQVTKTRGIGKLFPPNILPQEIDSDHPKRIRALVVESANPLSSYADIPAQEKAYAKLDLMVVIDVAMTETARAAHYVLPAASQFEKFEAAFFSNNSVHLRPPVVKALANTLSEPEIHTRILKAMGEISQDSLNELATAAVQDRQDPSKGIFQMAFMQAVSQNPGWNRYGPVLLKETLGKALPNGAEAAAVLWFTAHRYAQKYQKELNEVGFEKTGPALGEEIFHKLLTNPSGIKLVDHAPQNHWELIRHPDKKVHLSIPELLQWLDDLPQTAKEIALLEAQYPYNLIAGERRTYNANTILRNPEWRKVDKEGAMKVNPEDAAILGIESGDTLLCSSASGKIHIIAKVSDEVPAGIVSMPHGYGLHYDGAADYKTVGAAANQLTAVDYCDPLAKTPYHKNVRVRLEKVA